MSIKVRGKSYLIDVKVGAQRVRKTVRCSRQEARKIESDLRQELLNNQLPLHGIEEALLKYINEYIPHLKDQKGQKSKAKQLLPFIENKSFQDIPSIAAELKKLNIKPATINRRLALLRRICNLSYKEWGWIDKPVHISLLRENNERHVYLDRETVWKLANKCEGGNREAILLAAYTGLRRGEIFKAGKVEIGNQSVIAISETKTGKPRIIPVHKDIEFIDLPIKTTDALLRKAFIKARNAIKRPDLHFHDLRHTFASWLAVENVDMRIIGELLGHTQAQTTKRYTHLQNDTLRDAINKMGHK